MAAVSGVKEMTKMCNSTISKSKTVWLRSSKCLVGGEYLKSGSMRIDVSHNTLEILTGRRNWI